MADTQQEKEDNGRNFDDLREIEAAFKLGVGNNLDKMLAIVTGNYKCPSLPGEPDKITRSIKDNDEYRARMRMMSRRGGYDGGGDADYEQGDNNAGRSVVRNHNGYDRNESFRPTYREASSGQDYAPSPVMSKYASILNELERFRFADDDSRRERQLTHVVNTIRTALQELTIRDVAYNTRKAFKEYVEGVNKIAGGIQVNFNFKGTKVKVAARGAFNGDETVCVYREGEKVIGAVVRMEEDGEKTDLSTNYGITVG